MVIVTCNIKMLWDNETDRWYTETEDVPGLALESGSFDALVEKVRLIAPDVLEMNCDYVGPIHFNFLAHRTETIRTAS